MLPLRYGRAGFALFLRIILQRIQQLTCEFSRVDESSRAPVRRIEIIAAIITPPLTIMGYAVK